MRRTSSGFGSARARLLVSPALGAFVRERHSRSVRALYDATHDHGMGRWTRSVGHVADLLRAPVEWTRRRVATQPPSVRGCLVAERAIRPGVRCNDGGYFASCSTARCQRSCARGPITALRCDVNRTGFGQGLSSRDRNYARRPQLTGPVLKLTCVVDRTVRSLHTCALVRRAWPACFEADRRLRWRSSPRTSPDPFRVRGVPT